MSGNKNIHNSPKANTNGFSKNPQNINRKGNRKLISSVIDELENDGVQETSIQEIKGIYLRLVNLTIAELEEKISCDNEPSLVRIVSKNILSGKGFEIIERMFDRAVGRPLQQTDVTTNGQNINTQPNWIIADNSKKDE
jgi:UTP-glucose-1-phosphate uridylyltransferase